MSARELVREDAPDRLLMLLGDVTDGPEAAVCLLLSCAMAVLGTYCRMDRRDAENFVQDWLDATRTDALRDEGSLPRSGAV